MLGWTVIVFVWLFELAGHASVCVTERDQMIVREITELSKIKSNVILEDGMSFSLYKSELHRYQLKEGEPIEDAVYKKLIDTELPKRAKLRCMNLLKQRDYTESELRRKLDRGGYPDEIIQTALEYVKSYGYVDDEAYVRNYLDTYREKKSMLRMEHDLAKKGIGRNTVRKVYEQMDFSDEKDAELLQIQTLLVKKGYCGEDCTPEQQRKLYAFLLRRGYPASKITQCIKGTSYEEG